MLNQLHAAKSLLEAVVRLTNQNDGFLTLVLFCFTLAFGWASGIFSALMRKPKLRLRLMEGPNFCCTFPTGRSVNGVATHRTAIALYLSVSNVGNADTTIAAVHVGYRTNMRWSPRWLWLPNQVAALSDFMAPIGDHVKVYPFLMQKNAITGAGGETFVSVGGRATGVTYWEQSESWGGYFPRIGRRGSVRLKVRVVDSFERTYTSTVLVSMVALEDARKFTPNFGETLEALQRGPTTRPDAEAP